MFHLDKRQHQFAGLVAQKPTGEYSRLAWCGIPRSVLLVALCVGIACSSRSSEVQAHEPVPWKKTFHPISVSNDLETLAVILITNEDPFLVVETAKTPAEIGEMVVGMQRKPRVWCADLLERAYRNAVDQRADLQGRISLQSLAAGLPKELAGGIDVNAPARAVIAICDNEYRLLSFMVGVPDTDGLLALIKDAEAVAGILRLSNDQEFNVLGTIGQRSRGRLGRLWRDSFDKVLAATQLDGSEAKPSLGVQLQSLGKAFDPTYVADVRRRFGLVEKADETRLIMLEQHPETRLPWCEAMIPFIAGGQISELWRVLVEMIWGFPPITADADAEDLIAWFDLQIETESVVLFLSPPLSLQHVAWPPATRIRGRRGVGWQEVHARATKHPFRTVDAQQLAMLIHKKELKAVDIRNPTITKYVFIDRKRKLPLLVREGDPPGRFAGLLKRSKPKTTKE